MHLFSHAWYLRVLFRELFCRLFTGNPVRRCQKIIFGEFHFPVPPQLRLLQKSFTEEVFWHSEFCKKNYKTITLECTFLRMLSCKQWQTSGSNITKKMFWWKSFYNNVKDYYKNKCPKECFCKNFGQDGTKNRNLLMQNIALKVASTVCTAKFTDWTWDRVCAKQGLGVQTPCL